MTISIQTREIQYNAADGQRLVGYFAAPSSQTPHAGIIVAPEWWGRNEYTEQRARELAEHGYAALAIDMYGDKNVTTDAKQAYEWMMQTFADAVLFMKNELSVKTTKMLSGFAAGVMIAASVWSLLIPALEQSQSLGKMQFVPAVAGFMLGMFFLLILDTITPHMHLDNSVEGPKSNFSRQTMMVLAVTLHNIPEGMAVGVLYASWISGTTTITRAAALSLAIGIAIQNFPEGAIISMPLHSTGSSKLRAFVYGVLSGIVEPIAGILTILAIGIIEPVMPYLLSFAAGAMIYVVIEELVPEMSEGGHSNRATIAFMVGFCLMMTLDVMLG